MWFFLAVVGLGLLFYFSMKGGTRRAQEKVEEMRAQMQKDREDFERRHGRPANF